MEHAEFEGSRLSFFRQKHPGPAWGLERKRGLGCTFGINHLCVGVAGSPRGTVESERRVEDRVLDVTTNVSGTCPWARVL